MANFVFNRSKGRGVEYAERVNANDPANSVLIWSLWNYGAATDDTIGDLDDFAAIEANANAAEKPTGESYARKVLSDASGITITYDDTNNWVDVDTPDQTWTALGSGVNITDAVSGYDSDSTGGTDSSIRPITSHDFAISCDGSDVTMVLPSGGFLRAQ